MFYFVVSSILIRNADSKKVSSLLQLVTNALNTRSIICADPSTVKSVLLKLIELEASALNTHEEQSTARDLKQVLQIFRNGIAILDEVDLILHPLKSELTFSLGQRCGLSQKHRYLIPEFLVRATFGFELVELHGEHHSQLKSYFKDMHNTYTTVFRDRELIDPKSYSINFHGKGCLKEMYAHLLVCYLEFHFALSDHLKQTLFEFIFEKNDFKDTPAKFDHYIAGSECDAVARLCRVWCQELLPHILSKQHRVHYGLTSYDDITVVEHPRLSPAFSITITSAEGEERFLKAVPFLGKELPSPDSEFSSMDVTFGFTALSFMKQQLRLRDVCGLVAYMQKHALCSDYMQAQKVFSMWRVWLGDSADGREFWNLEAIDCLDTNAMARLHAVVAQKNCSQLKQYYLLHIVYPATSSFSKESISADALDMSNMFSCIFGFSGTLTKNVYPVSWSVGGRDFRPNMNDNHQARMRRILCDSEHVDVGYMVQCSDSHWRVVSDEHQSRNFESSWKVQDLLEAVVTRTGVSCLIDCGALVTGLSNVEVAKFLMNLKSEDPRFEEFRKKFSVCVFWDSSDAPVALERGGSVVIPLSVCSKPAEEWFVYFDHVHTTGIDISLPLTAVAVVTIGSDTALRDYQQACWRLRQLGLGQRVQAVLVPEIHRLFVKAAALNLSDEVPTLQAFETLTLQGGLRPRNLFGFLDSKQDKSESRQLLCLRMRELHGVWRRRHFHGIMYSDAVQSKLLARKFVRSHNEDGFAGHKDDHQESACATDADELQLFQIIDTSIQCLLQGASSPRARSAHQHNWDALAVQQKQQQAQQQKEALRQNPKIPFAEAPLTRWFLRDALPCTSHLSREAKNRPCQLREVSKTFSFYPDFLYASQTFAAAFNCAVPCVLPKAEVILEIKSREPSFARRIVLVTLAEAETLFRMLLMNPQDELAELCTLHALDSYGYCSQVLPSVNTYSDACREYLFAAPPGIMDCWFKTPSSLCVATAFARLLNCELNFDLFQGACIASALQTWNWISRRVRIKGLVSHAHYNEFVGMIVEPLDGQQRWTIRLENMPENVLKIKSSNFDFVAADNEQGTIRDIVFASFRTVSSQRPVLAVDPQRSRVLCLVAGVCSDPMSSLSKVQRWQSAALTCVHLARLLSCAKITSSAAAGTQLMNATTLAQHAGNSIQEHVEELGAHFDIAASANAIVAIFGPDRQDRVALNVIFDRLRPNLVDLTLEGLADAFELVLQMNDTIALACLSMVLVS
jgi:hypothetical protein